MYMLFHFKASMNKLYENIPSTYKMNTLLHDSISIKRSYESNAENTNFKRKKKTILAT
jgi:hypothetical protein